jgi:hypothetical protein
MELDVGVSVVLGKLPLGLEVKVVAISPSPYLVLQILDTHTLG